MIMNCCLQVEPDVAKLAAHLLEAKPEPEYFRELRQIAERDPLCGNAREKIKSGLEKAETAKERLVEANLRLVIWVARKHGGMTLMDRIQEGNIGIIRAAERFDYRRAQNFPLSLSGGSAKRSTAQWLTRQELSASRCMCRKTLARSKGLKRKRIPDARGTLILSPA